MAPYVLSVIGSDRAGLVEALADVVAEHGGSWDRSHMTELAGTFAGVVQVRVPDAAADDFTAALGPLGAQGLLHVAVAPGADGAADEGRATGAPVAFTVVGNDRPGIVREVSSLLAALDVSIVDLRTWTASAAHAGGELFHAAAEVALPVGLGVDDLVDALQDLSDDLMVDLAPAGAT